MMDMMMLILVLLNECTHIHTAGCTDNAGVEFD